MAFISSVALATAHSDSLAPYQYDAGVRARVAGDPLNAQCDIRKSEPLHTLVARDFCYSTDGQLTWSSVLLTNTGGDTWACTTPSISGDAHWRFYIESDSIWAGQTPVYDGAETCRLPANWYVYWEDTPGLDSSAYLPGSGDWLDIRGAGFCISSGKFYGKIVKTNDDWHVSDGSRWWTTDLFDDNYGYMFAINNPLEPSGDIFYTVAQTVTADPPDLTGHVEMAPGLLKAKESTSEIWIVVGVPPVEIVFVAETMFVSCNITDFTGDSDFGTWPNNIRYLNVQALTMHLHQYGSLLDPQFHQYFADQTICGHAYYQNPIAPWLSSTTAPNTLPVLTSPSADYDPGFDETTVEVIYTDTDENPPEYVRVDIGSRAVYDLNKAEVVGPYGWIDGVKYSGVIPGYHGFGADFTFECNDGVDSYSLPAGELSVAEKTPRSFDISVFPNPFNSACRISAPGGVEIEILDINGRIVYNEPVVAKHVSSADESNTSRAYSAHTSVIWDPADNVGSGVYFVRVTANNASQTNKIVYIK